MFTTVYRLVVWWSSQLVTTSYYSFAFIHIVLPLGLDAAIIGWGAYYLSKLKAPQTTNVTSLFGPMPGSKESEANPENLVRCIAHRGAGLDAPENTLEAFKYCVEHDCTFVELDVRSSKDNELVLLHDAGLERVANSDISDIKTVDWDTIKSIDVGSNHPNRQQFNTTNLCLLKDALAYLLENNCRIVIDVKGTDKAVIEGVVRTFQETPSLYERACVTCFNPWVLYKIRSMDAEIVGALSYRPYCFGYADYDATSGPTNPRHLGAARLAARAADALHAATWRLTARWCGVSAVFLHKDIVSLSEVRFWHEKEVRCVGWCVNRPLEKLYWRGVLNAPYLANTLVAEPDRIYEKQVQEKTEALEVN